MAPNAASQVPANTHLWVRLSCLCASLLSLRQKTPYCHHHHRQQQQKAHGGPTGTASYSGYEKSIVHVLGPWAPNPNSFSLVPWYALSIRAFFQLKGPLLRTTNQSLALSGVIFQVPTPTIYCMWKRMRVGAKGPLTNILFSQLGNLSCGKGLKTSHFVFSRVHSSM